MTSRRQAISFVVFIREAILCCRCRWLSKSAARLSGLVPFNGNQELEWREAQEDGLVERMLMRDGGIAPYDNAFYNIVRPSADDAGVVPECWRDGSLS